MKLYAVEQYGEFFDANYYFDFAEEAKTAKFAIEGNRAFISYTFDEYDEAKRHFDDFLGEFEAIEEGRGWYKNYTEAANDILTKSNGKPFTAREVGELKRLYKKICAEKNYNFYNYACELLSIITDEKYTETTLRGYCQGDWQRIFYPERIKKELDYIEACFFGTGTEFGILTADDDKTPEEVNEADDAFWHYTAVYKTSDIKKELSDAYGVPVEDVIIYSITETKTIKPYKHNYTQN